MAELGGSTLSEMLHFSKWGFAIVVNTSHDDKQMQEITNDPKWMVFRIYENAEEAFVILHGFTKKAKDSDSQPKGLSCLFKLLSGRKMKPKRITLAFIGKISQERHGEFLKECSENYEVEIWEREKNFDGFYNSFSQIINESVIESESEFIFWIHPRVTVNFEMLDSLVLLLCSGYAFASEINFGFFGCPKQLFRKIGMFDERFVGSEHEDTDWFFRMKFNGIPSFERGNHEICPDDAHVWGPLRGLGRTIFEEKWIRRFDDLYTWEWPYNWCLSKFYENEKKLNDGKDNCKIESTWGDISISHGTSFIPRLSLSCNLHENIFEEDYEVIDSEIQIKLERNSLFVQFTCPEKTFVFVTAHDKSGKVATSMRIISNQWFSNPIKPINHNDSCEIRINCGQYRVFHGFLKPGTEQNIKTGLKIKTQKLKTQQS
jgi:hypothetical protein